MPKVLIVDDSSSVRRVLERVLQAQFEVVAAQNGEAALEQFDRTIPGLTVPDLAIIDVIMPGIGGLELCRRLRALSPQTPVVLISGAGDAQIERQAYAVGAVAVIPKPFSPEDLNAALGAALRPPATEFRSALPEFDLQQQPQWVPPMLQAPLPASTQAEPEPEPPFDLLATLVKFLGKPEVVAVTLSDRQGVCLAHVGNHADDAQTLASYSRFLLIAADVLGAHFGAEATGGVLLEFPHIAFYLGRVDEQHILGLHLTDTKALSVVRYLIRQTLPSLVAGLQSG